MISSRDKHTLEFLANTGVVHSKFQEDLRKSILSQQDKSPIIKELNALENDLNSGRIIDGEKTIEDLKHVFLFLFTEQERNKWPQLKKWFLENLSDHQYLEKSRVGGQIDVRADPTQVRELADSVHELNLHSKKSKPAHVVGETPVAFLKTLSVEERALRLAEASSKRLGLVEDQWSDDHIPQDIHQLGLFFANVISIKEAHEASLLSAIGVQFSVSQVKVRERVRTSKEVQTNLKMLDSILSQNLYVNSPRRTNTDNFLVWCVKDLFDSIFTKEDRAGYPHVDRWLTACLSGLESLDKMPVHRAENLLLHHHVLYAEHHKRHCLGDERIGKQIDIPPNSVLARYDADLTHLLNLGWKQRHAEATTSKEMTKQTPAIAASSSLPTAAASASSSTPKTQLAAPTPKPATIPEPQTGSKPFSLTLTGELTSVESHIEAVKNMLSDIGITDIKIVQHERAPDGDTLDRVLAGETSSYT